MKYLQTLDPGDPHYTQLLAQKAAHRLCFPKDLKGYQKKVPALIRRRLAAAFKIIVCLTAFLFAAIHPHPLTWNLGVIAALAAIIFVS